MRAPSTSALLDAWDAGSDASPVRRALLLLATVRLESPEQLAAMPLGWITAELLRIRRAVLGPALACLANCPRCSAVVETSVDVGQVLGADVRARDTPAAGPYSLTSNGYAIEFRLATAADVLALQGDAAAATRALAASLVCSAMRADEPVAAADLPHEICGALEQAVVEHDPLAHIELGVDCPGCRLHWVESLDVIDFLWTELTAFAQRAIRDVARLACAFGWSEAEILSLSEQRRRRYLELLPS